MDAGFQHQHPKDRPQKQDRRDPVRPLQVQPQKPRQRRKREEQIIDMQFAGVEKRDDEDRAEVVKDRQRQQEDLQRRWHPLAQKRQNADGKGDVGRGGDGPAALGDRVRPVEDKEDQRRHRHAADRRHARQHHVARVLQLALHHLALQLKPDEEEEDRHQAVIDPQDQFLRQPLAIQKDGEFLDEDGLVQIRQAGICDEKGQNGGRHQNDPPGCIVAEEAVEGTSQCHIEFPIVFLIIGAEMGAGCGKSTASRAFSALKRGKCGNGGENGGVRPSGDLGRGARGGRGLGRGDAGRPDRAGRAARSDGDA